MTRRVLILDFDIFSTVGGGQTFYRHVVERHPETEFWYPSSGPDRRLAFARSLPANARPFLYDAKCRVEYNGPKPDGPDQWILPHFTAQIARVGFAVQGMTFQVVDVPSFFPAAHVVRPVLTSLGVMIEKFALGLVGWASVSARNAYEGEGSEQEINALARAERASFEAADVRYTISNLEAATNAGHDLPVAILQMHDALEAFPPPSRLPPGSGPPDLWYVGRLDGAKGTDLFIELAGRMPKRLYRRCLFTGPDNTWTLGARWSERLLALAQDRGVEASYLGTLSDEELRKTVYQGRSVVVIPSRTDAFNYVALEAVLNGCPILLSERAGALGFLRDNYPHLTPSSMDPENLDVAAEQLRSLLEGYPSIARRCRAALLRDPFPQPRMGFMEQVYGAEPRPSPERKHQIGEEANASRSHLPLLKPDARNWRIRRTASESPDVSVIIPTLNRPTLLAPTLASLTRQTLEAFEVIVVDDGSNDAASVRDVAEAFAPLVRFMRIGNAGEAGAVNRGIAVARGRYLGFLSDDDAYHPELLATAVNALDRDPAAIGAYPDWDIVDTAGYLVEQHRLPEFDRFTLFGHHWCLPGPGVVVRRSVISEIGGRDLSFRFVSDFDLWLRATADGPMIHLPEKLAYWRLHTSNLTTSDRRLHMARERIRLLEKLFEDPAEVARIGRHRETAFAAAHLAAAAILGKEAATAASEHLREARRLDNGLVENLPPNMSAYPALWPADDDANTSSAATSRAYVRQTRIPSSAAQSTPTRSGRRRSSLR